MSRAGLARRRPLVAGVLAALATLALAFAVPQSWREIAAAQAEDALMRVAARLMRVPMIDPPLVVVDIDQATIETLGAWPWPRERLANLVEKSASGMPKALVLDMLLAEADPRSPVAELKRRGISLDPAALAALERATPDGDARLALALGKAPAVLGLILDPQRPGDAPAAQILSRGSATLTPFWRGAGVAGPHPPLMQAIAGLGVIALPGDTDGVVRRAPLFVSAGAATYPGLALEAIRVWQDASGYLVEGPPTSVLAGEKRLALPGDALLRLVPGLVPDGTITRLSARDVAAGGARIPSGAIVLIGGSAPELGGLRTTQDDALAAAVTIQARATAQLLAGVVPLTPPLTSAIQAGLALAASALAILAALTLGPVGGLAALFTGLLALAGLSIGAFIGWHWLIAPLLPALMALAAFSASSIVSFVETRQRAARVRQRFEQHLSPQVVSMIVADPSLLKLRGEKREITAIFTDVEDFTSMTERADPEALVGVLDEYFEGLAAIFVRHGGMIDKIVGDAIHAFFNAPLDLPGHSEKALACALEIARWSREFRARPKPSAIGFGRTRIGVETGTAIVGDVGIRSKLDYTAHGAVVNSAARLEAANKTFGSTICLGPRISALLPPEDLRPLGEIRLRGFSSACRVFEPWPVAATPAWRRAYLDAMHLLETDPDAAARAFATLAEAFDDKVSLTLAAARPG